MILFFDTSALVKFFHQEKGTEGAKVINPISGPQVIPPGSTNANDEK